MSTVEVRKEFSPHFYPILPIPRFFNFLKQFRLGYDLLAFQQIDQCLLLDKLAHYQLFKAAHLFGVEFFLYFLLTLSRKDRSTGGHRKAFALLLSSGKLDFHVVRHIQGCH